MLFALFSVHFYTVVFAVTLSSLCPKPLVAILCLHFTSDLWGQVLTYWRVLATSRHRPAVEICWGTVRKPQLTHSAPTTSLCTLCSGFSFPLGNNLSLHKINCQIYCGIPYDKQIKTSDWDMFCKHLSKAKGDILCAKL